MTGVAWVGKLLRFKHCRLYNWLAKNPPDVDLWSQRAGWWWIVAKGFGIAARRPPLTARVYPSQKGLISRISFVLAALMIEFF